MNLREIGILKIDIEDAEAQLFHSKQFLSDLNKVWLLAWALYKELLDQIKVINIIQDEGL